jgi:hypothetical protein
MDPLACHQRKITTRTRGGSRGLPHRYITAYGELATLDVKHVSENFKENMLKKQLCESTETLVDLVHANMLKNQCESTENLVGLVRAKYENSTDHFKDSCDYLQNYWYEQKLNKNQELLAPMNTKSRRTHVSKINEVISEDSLMDNRVVAYRHAKMKRGLRRRSGSLSSVVERVCFACTGSVGSIHPVAPLTL